MFIFQFKLSQFTTSSKVNSCNQLFQNALTIYQNEVQKGMLTTWLSMLVTAG